MKAPVLALLLVLGCTAFAQEKTDKRLKNFDQTVLKAMADWKVQGVAIAIVEKNRVVYAKGYGFRDVAKKEPVTPNTLFAIGSCTKAFTAAGVCLLQEDNLVKLDEPIRKYMPSFTLYDEYASNQMTPRDLLCHRSGLPRHDLTWYGSPATRKELYERLRYLKPSKPFRTTYQYQNLMFMTAGYMVGELSGEGWEAYTKRRLLDPMEMTSTNFSVNDLMKAADRSLGYVENNDKVVEIPYMNIDQVGPAGSINSSVNDMSKWLITLINGGQYKGKQVLSANSIRELQTPAMTAPAAVPLPYDENGYGTYGLGWSIVSYRGHIRVEHGGNIDGFSASTAFLPRDSVGVVVLTNMNGSASTSVFRNYAIDQILGLSAIDWNGRLLKDVNKAKADAANQKKIDNHRILQTRPSHPLEHYVGKFQHPGYGIIGISKAGDSLAIDVHGLKSPLRHYHYDYFEATDKQYLEGLKVSFATNLRGEVDRLFTQLEPAVDDIEFKRVADIKLTAEDLQKYVGDYDFGGVPARVFARGDQLFLFVTGQPEYALTPSKPHTFTCEALKGFEFSFRMDGGNRAVSLTSLQPNGTYTAVRK